MCDREFNDIVHEASSKTIENLCVPCDFLSCSGPTLTVDAARRVIYIYMYLYIYIHVDLYVPVYLYGYTILYRFTGTYRDYSTNTRLLSELSSYTQTSQFTMSVYSYAISTHSYGTKSAFTCIAPHEQLVLAIFGGNCVCFVWKLMKESFVLQRFFKMTNSYKNYAPIYTFRCIFYARIIRSNNCDRCKNIWFN